MCPLQKDIVLYDMNETKLKQIKNEMQLNAFIDNEGFDASCKESCGAWAVGGTIFGPT